jgi:hypothetical protein
MHVMDKGAIGDDVGGTAAVPGHSRPAENPCAQRSAMRRIGAMLPYVGRAVTAVVDRPMRTTVVRRNDDGHPGGGWPSGPAGFR